MAIINLTLSAKTDITNLTEIRIRFRHGKIDQQAKTKILIQSEYWDSETQQVIIPNFRLMNDEQKQLKQFLTNQTEKLTTLTSLIQTTFNNADKEEIIDDWLKTTIDKHNFPEKYVEKIEEIPKQSFFNAFDEFMIIKDFSEWRNKAYKVVIRTMKRFEMYVQLTQDKSFSFDLDTVTPIVITEFVVFLRNEHTLFEKYPSIYEAIPETRTPQPRGQNTSIVWKSLKTVMPEKPSLSQVNSLWLIGLTSSKKKP